MANLVVTKTGISMTVDMGDYSAVAGVSKASYRADELSLVQLMAGDFIKIYMAETNEEWLLTYDGAYSGNEYFIIDTIDAVSPTSNADLFSKLVALRG